MHESGWRPPSVMTTALERGFQLLRQAREFAMDVHVNVWQFALEGTVLLDIGVEHNQLRWLLCQGYLEQRHEVTKPQAKQRRFRRVANMSFAKASCFVLTDKGYRLARCGDLPQPSSATAETTAMPPPVWIRERRELWLGSNLVKRFR